MPPLVAVGVILCSSAASDSQAEQVASHRDRPRQSVQLPASRLRSSPDGDRRNR